MSTLQLNITPEVANAKIQLVAAGECTMYKRTFGNCIIDNDTNAIIVDQIQPFQFHPANPVHHTGVEICLEHL